MQGSLYIDSVIGNRIVQRSNEDRKGNGKPINLVKGQVITGTVLEIGEQITLDFNGQEVKTPIGSLKDIMVGDRVQFEVHEATSSMILLKSLKKIGQDDKQTNVTSARVDTDRETFLSKQANHAHEADTDQEGAQKSIDEILAKMTERDYRMLEAEGIKVEELTLEGLCTALKRIRGTGSDSTGKMKGKSDAYAVGDDRKQAHRRTVSTIGKTDLEKRIITKLEKADLPVTEEAVRNISQTLSLGNIISQMDDKTIRFLLSNDLEPTVENIYKAYYSSRFTNAGQGMALSNAEWASIRLQAEEVLKDAGYEINQENLGDAKWLLDNGLTLTDKNLDYLKGLEEIKGNEDVESILDRVVDGMKEGISPEKVPLYENYEKAYDRVLDKLESIDEEAIARGSRMKGELSIRKLYELRKGYKPDRQEPTKNTDIPTEAEVIHKQIRVQRQLEEIRLKMTREAAIRLVGKGFHIETESLEKVVEELRLLEESCYRDLFKEAGIIPDEASIKTLDEATKYIRQLKYMPNYVLGDTLLKRNEVTIPDLLESGASLLRRLEEANEAYETLMTVPDSEYGDSIQKAFLNMDSLLDELGIEQTKQNQKAVRILGYNQMEITRENIDLVKMYDYEVQRLMEHLTPPVAVRLIRDGEDPLTVPVGELNDRIDSILKEVGVTEEDSYSSYLWKLEREEAISPTERQAYIGIYRLLYHIGQRDTAAIGTVLKEDRELTLDHLLSAVRTNRSSGMDIAVDDSFGLLDRTIRSKDSVTDQLGVVFHKGARAIEAMVGEGSVDNQDSSKDPIGIDYSSTEDQTDGKDPDNTTEQGKVDERLRYLEHLLKNMLGDIAPDKLMELGKRYLQSGNTAAGAEDTTSTSNGNGGIWEAIKDIPLEQLADELHTYTDRDSYGEELYQGRMNELRELLRSSDQAVRFLNELKLPGTPSNILMANMILSSEDTLFRKLSKVNKDPDGYVKTGLKEIAELSDKLIDKQTMNEAYDQLEQSIRDILDVQYREEAIDSRKLTELRQIGKQMSFLKNLARREFYQIPVETEEGITNVNLTIIHNSGNAGNVSVAIHSERLGDIRADFSFSNSSAKGFISCDNRQGLEILKKNRNHFSELSVGEQINLDSIDYGLQYGKRNSWPTVKTLDEGKVDALQPDTERKLYDIARVFIQSVSLAEKAQTQ